MTTGMPRLAAATTDLVRWSFEMINRHDVAPLRRLWTADTVERFPDRTCRGPDEIARYFDDAFAALPDFHMEIRAIAGDGDDVFVHWHLTGTRAQPPHRRVEIDGMDHFVVRDGVVVSNFVVFDQMEFARQLGLMPPTAER
jgi:predicted SnoaL-like aldol condensation-catalyzing enzyme